MPKAYRSMHKCLIHKGIHKYGSTRACVAVHEDRRRGVLERSNTPSRIGGYPTILSLTAGELDNCLGILSTRETIGEQTIGGPAGGGGYLYMKCIATKIFLREITTFDLSPHYPTYNIHKDKVHKTPSASNAKDITPNGR